MTTLHRIVAALTCGGADDGLDVLLQLCLIAFSGTVFVTGLVLLAGAAQ